MRLNAFKTLVSGALLFICLLGLPSYVSADDGGLADGGAGAGGLADGGGGEGGINVQPRIVNPISGIDSIEEFLIAVLEIVRNIGFLLAVVFIVYSGFLFVVAGGDETKLKKAKSAFTWGIIGTAVLLGAEVFTIALQGTINAIGS